MTARMQKHRERKDQEGMVQVRVWVPKEHEQFIKEMAKQCRPDQPEPQPPKRYGRRASEAHIRLAEIVAHRHQKEPPVHLYDHHISLSAWVRGMGGV